VLTLRLVGFQSNKIPRLEGCLYGQWLIAFMVWMNLVGCGFFASLSGDSVLKRD